jgi:hypothetical protein
VKAAQVGDEPPRPRLTLRQPGPQGNSPPVAAGQDSAIAANAASTRGSPVLLRASANIRAAAAIPAWCRLDDHDFAVQMTTDAPSK